MITGYKVKKRIGQHLQKENTT